MDQTTFPVAVSDKALQQLRRLFAKDGREGIFLRVGVKGGGCSGLEYVMKLDTERKPIDLSTLVGGMEIVCDSKSAQFLKGSTLDYTGNLIGGGSQFQNPNAGRSCGCGTSFMPRSA